MPVWDLSAASYDSKVSPALTGGAWGFTFNADGTRMYDTDRNNCKVYPYTLSTAWDVSTATVGTAYTATAQVGTLNDVDFNDDGTKMYLLDQDHGGKVWQYTLSTAYDVSTASYASKSLVVGGTAPSPQHLFFKPDGTSVWVTKQSTVYQFTLSTAWDISTGSYASKSYAFPQDTLQANSTFFKTDGTKMWMTGSGSSGNPGIWQYSLSTAWDVTTATYDSVNLSIGARDTTPRDIYIKSDGTKLWFVGSASNKAWQYTLGSAGRGWVVGSMSLN